MAENPNYTPGAQRVCEWRGWRLPAHSLRPAVFARNRGDYDAAVRGELPEPRRLSQLPIARAIENQSYATA